MQEAISVMAGAESEFTGEVRPEAMVMIAVSSIGGAGKKMSAGADAYGC
ncbi:Uncharacterised protein [Serratia entomophila]|nr:Uncharacterised protein [Serratia entomophila]CAI1729063.1 Uncharacterised protein [Serratia entomophila]